MVKFTSDAICPANFFVGSLITKPISLLVMGLFRFSISLKSALVVCVFLGICPFNLNYAIFLAYSCVHNPIII